MKRNRLWLIAIVTLLVTVRAGGILSAQDKYAVKVPGGLAFAEFKGYEDWQVVSKPPQGNDAKCGFQCHTLVTARDYVFTEFGAR
jgi:hypothetical protein